MERPHLLFVTGKLAEPALRRLLADLGPQAGFDYSVAVLPITVVSLATTAWVACVPRSRARVGATPSSARALGTAAIGVTHRSKRPDWQNRQVRHGARAVGLQHIKAEHARRTRTIAAGKKNRTWR